MIAFAIIVGALLLCVTLVLIAEHRREPQPIPMILNCPTCATRHVDRADPAHDWTNPPHRSHLCCYCGTIWRPADVATVGVVSITTRGASDNWQ